MDITDLKTIHLIIGVILLTLGLQDQEPGIPVALHEKLLHADGGEAQISVFDELADYYKTRNNDSALYYINKGLALSEQIGYAEGHAEMLANLGDFLVMQDELSLAREKYELSSEILYETGNFMELAQVYLVLGNVYWVQDNYVVALDYYTRGEKLADSLSMTSLLPDFHNNLGTAYIMMEDYDQSLKYYTSAIELYRQDENLAPVPLCMINVVTIYERLNRLEEAREMCREALSMTDSIPDAEIAKIVAYEAFGNISYSEGDYRAAYAHYDTALRYVARLSPEYMGPRSVNEAQLLYSKGSCLYALGQYENASTVLYDAYELGLNTGQLRVVKEVSILLSLIEERFGNTNKALEFIKLHTKYADSMSSESISRKITQIKMKYEFDKTLRLKEMERLSREEAQKRKELVLFIVIGSILSALVVLFLLLRLQRNKTRRIELMRKNLKQDLEFKNKELTTNVMYLLQKNEFIMAISNRLSNMRDRFKAENRDVIDAVIREIENSSKAVNWKDFELRFQEVHSTFYEKINALYPDLTPNELKLCAFLRLNMTTKEISSITYQSYNSIKMARHRLRKKMKMDSADGLVTYLQGL